MTNRIRNIFFLFGIIAVVVMFFTLDVSLTDLWKCICQARGWIVAVFLLWVPLYLMNALTWRIILKGTGKCVIPYALLFKLTISGFALNYATPAGLMGGEPYKIMELSPYVGRERATSSVLLFSMMHIFSHFWYWFAASLLYMLLLDVSSAMFCVLLFMMFFSLCGVYLFLKGYRNGMVVKILNVISCIPGLKNRMTRFMRTHRNELAQIDAQIASLHTQDRRSFYMSFGMEFVGRVLQAFEIYFVLAALGVTGSFVQLFLYATLIIALTSLFANLLFFMPLQLGGREGGFVMSCVQLGFTNGMGVYISIICRIRELFWTTIGLLLIKVGNRCVRNRNSI
jgi:hypothetical protein